MPDWMKFLLVVLAVAVVAAAVGLLRGTGNIRGGSLREMARPIRVVRPERRAVSDWPAAAGEVEAYRKAHLAFEIPGRIAKVLVEEGANVEAGSLLAELDSSDSEIALERALAVEARAQAVLDEVIAGPRPQDLRAAAARLDAATAACRKAESDLIRARGLADEEGVSAAELDARTRALEMARGQRDAAAAQLEALQLGSRREHIAAARAGLKEASAGVGAARRAVEKCRLTVPFAGTVAARHLDPGALAGPSTPAVTIVAGNPAIVSFGATRERLDTLNLNDPITVRTRSGGELSGTVESVSPEADSVTRMYRVRVRVPNESGALKIGELVTCRPSRVKKRSVLSIPLCCLVSASGTEGIVMVVEEEEGSATASERKVKIGKVFDGWVEVTAGLDESTRVISEGSRFVLPGRPVKVLEDEAGSSVGEVE